MLKGCKTDVLDSKGTKDSVDNIFSKYSSFENRNFSVMDWSQFSKLMKSISLGRVSVQCRQDDPKCLDDKLAQHNNDLATGKQKYKRAAATGVNELERKELEAEKKRVKEHELHWGKHIKKCSRTKTILTNHGVNFDKGISKLDFIRICPVLIEQIDSKACTHYHERIRKHKHYNDIPTQVQVWGYSFLSITVISVLSLAVIALVPCLGKSYYGLVMAFLVALAIGTLSGDAMLHLIPHAFVEGANAATNITISQEMKLKQHYSQVWRALFVLCGIYVFFLVEQMMKLKAICRGDTVSSSHGHSHGDKKGKSHRLKSKGSPVLKVEENGDTLNHRHLDTSSDSKEGDGSQVNMLEVPFAPSPNLSSVSDIEENSLYHTDDRHHHEHHGGEKNLDKNSKISSVAWMVVVGDGFHNFSDGLAVGAAFSASLSSGVSTAIAVFCHELPHELGDFAILIKSGMTIKQAIVYNVVSALLAYIGVVVGIFAGGNELGRHFILSITAGLFLYVSLTDMLPELSHQEVPNRSIYVTFIFQHLGLLCGVGLMLFISLYEHSM